MISTDNTGETDFIGNLDRFVYKLMDRHQYIKYQII